MTVHPQTLDVLDLVVRYIGVVFDVLFQKWRMRKLPSLGNVGERLPQGSTVVVTGPTSGIGTETAAEFARRGCHVVLACRSPSRGQKLKEAIEREAKMSGVADPRIEVMELDLASLASVRAFCDAWEKKDAPIDILVNNAGVFAMGAPRSTTQDGLELHLGTNYVSCFLLTMRLLPFLRKAGEAMAKSGCGREARVVMVASKLHEIGAIHTTDPQLQSKYSAAAAYGQSKLAQVLFTAELRRRIPSTWNVGCYSLHPGNVVTEVVRTLPQVVQAIYRFFLRAILLTVAEGARATLAAATASYVKRDASRTLGYIDSDCVAKEPSSFARDPVMARWLWRFSLETVALPRKYDLDPAE